MIGSHVAVGGGLVKVGLAEAREVGAEIIQLFGGNPRSWAPRAADPAADEAFREACEIPVVLHAPHLINLCSPSERVLKQSVDALELCLERAAAIGAGMVVVHAGSLVDGTRRTTVLNGLHDVIAPILDRTDVRLLIEPTAGGGEAAAANLETTGDYIQAVNDERVGVCLDTCHLHAAGEDLAKITTDLPVALLHVNDSRDPQGSRRDRHESLGRGTIGVPALEAFLKNFPDVPMLVETPTHAEDVALLKELTRNGAAGSGGRPPVGSSTG
ncbi:deoxyribonuclease IV [Kribbella antibiotica]|uniref:deoxyribonuclease IV n=1 Tax=Kribbella antibiotica TaxID=190195 RepID=UPI0014051E8A|nr:deoxyribonuclease IV [Kribbella antibiotica]